MTEMKYYITYANWKPEAQGQEAMKNAMKKWTKKIEETGCEVVFWGAALGVSEGVHGNGVQLHNDFISANHWKTN